MKICVFGLGYVGTTGTACLAELGHHVIGVDINPDKVALLNAGQSPVFEPDLDDLLKNHVARGAIEATTDAAAALAEADCILICVGTPSDSRGRLDDGHLHGVIAQAAEARARSGRVLPIIVRSTALPNSHAALMELIESHVGDDQPVAYCVHPEFLRAGEAVRDFMDPPKIVFGCTDDAAAEACRTLYPGFTAPTFFTDPMTAAITKYADNCFHAVKVTFANEIGRLSHSLGVDPRAAMELFCADRTLNISEKYLRPGFAFGGSCLPKDLRAMLAHAHTTMVSAPMLNNVLPSNDLQVDDLIKRVLEHDAASVGLFGLAFKDGTDDLRESPMVKLAETLSGKGKVVRIHDPALRIARLVGANLTYAVDHLPHLAQLLEDDPAKVVAESNLVIVARNVRGVPWTALPWRNQQRVVDLVGTLSAGDLPTQTEGLYW